MSTDTNILKRSQTGKKTSDEDLVFSAIVSYLHELSRNDYIKEHQDEINLEEVDTAEPGRLLNLIPYLNDLKIHDKEAISVCQIKAKKLLRVKAVVIRKHLERAYDIIRKEQLEFWGSDGSPEESDMEGVDPNNLMEVQDTNQMNKGVVSLWKVPTTPSEAASPAGDDSAKKNGKKRERQTKDSRDTSSKKLKGMIFGLFSKKVFANMNAGDKPERTSQLKTTLKDLGGIDKIIQDVLELIGMPLSHPEIYQHIGTDTPRGVLLHGPPGCGKTVLANAISNELGVPFISISAPSIVSGMSGESEKKLREVFEEAKSLAPCILFLDEIDAITPKRDSAQREMERRIVAQLLTCMDDVSFEKTGGRPVIIIGATNRPDSIDPALRRGGRFDREICMNVPDEEAREKILQKICSKLRLEGNFDYKKLARLTPGFVGADLQGLVSAAGVAAIKRIFDVILKDSISPKSEDPVESTGESLEKEENNQNGDVQMDDVDESSSATNPNIPEVITEELKSNPASVIERFLLAHPEPLSEEELTPLAIKFDDFSTALPTIQPSSKREGFATVPDVNWEDVGALESIREELEYAIVEPIRNPDLYKSVGVNAPSGVLLWGPPGCGKTLLAKAVASESQANFISVRGPELLNKYVGESERAVRQVFTRARASVPCIIFFDELDALVPHRDDTNSEVSSRVVNTLLTELDGVGDRQGIFVVAATNRPDMIDSAMMRPGRLDKQLMVELPSPDERVSILKTVTRTSPLAQDVDITGIAHDERCRNFSGADLSALTREAAVYALKKHIKSRRLGAPIASEPSQVLISNEDFNEAFKKVRPSVSDMEREKYRMLQQRLGGRE